MEQLQLISTAALLFGTSLWSTLRAQPSTAELRASAVGTINACTPEVQVKVFLSSDVVVDAVSFGMAHDAAVLQVVSCGFSGVAAALNGGTGPGFWSCSISPLTDGCVAAGSGITVGMVVDSLITPRGTTIPPGTGQEIVTVTYQPRPGLTPGMQSPLGFVECLRPAPDTEPTACVVTSGSISITPRKVPGIVGVVAGCFFRRGDGNCDGRFDISDPVTILLSLFAAGRLPAGIPCCPDATDTNDDGTVNISDAFTALNRLFRGAPPLPSPYPVCGDDLTADILTICHYPQEICVE